MDVSERLERHLTKTPDVAAALFVAPNATILGDVQLGKDSSVWYGAVLRGDIESIRIGEATNIQDLTLIHLANDLPVRVGSYCTIGHRAIIHACWCATAPRACINTSISMICLNFFHRMICWWRMTPV